MKLDTRMLGRRIAAMRELRSLTQRDLAEKSGVTQVTIARLETDKMPRVSLDTIVALAEALQVSVDYLAFGRNLGREHLPDEAGVGV